MITQFQCLLNILLSFINKINKILLIKKPIGEQFCMMRYCPVSICPIYLQIYVIWFYVNDVPCTLGFDSVKETGYESTMLRIKVLL